MRLRILEHGHRPWQRALLGLIRPLVGFVPGPALVMSYRGALFGKHFTACMQEGLCRGKYWSRGELELFAAFVSHKSSCTF